MSEPETIRCRAHASPNCYDGKPSKPVYGDTGMAGDGTYNGTSVVCCACYLRLGGPTHTQLRAMGL
jgi:hypothetical protein